MRKIQLKWQEKFVLNSYILTYKGNEWSYDFSTLDYLEKEDFINSYKYIEQNLGYLWCFASIIRLYQKELLI